MFDVIEASLLLVCEFTSLEVTDLERMYDSQMGIAVEKKEGYLLAQKESAVSWLKFYSSVVFCNIHTK
jgi:hypothetical protein